MFDKAHGKVQHHFMLSGALVEQSVPTSASEGLQRFMVQAAF